MKVHEVLEAFWRKEVDTHKVMRSIAAHDDWLVPLLHVPAVLGRAKVDRMVWFGTRFFQPKRRLLIYSDVAIARAVFDQGGVLGPYAAGISARDLFSRVPPDFDQIIVNFGAPESQQLFMAGPGFGDIAVWLDALAVEDALSGPERLVALRRYDAYFVPRNPEGTLKMLPLDEATNSVTLCTAPDTFAALSSIIEACGEGPLLRGQISGERLFELLPLVDAACVVVNPYGTIPDAVFAREELLGVPAAAPTIEVPPPAPPPPARLLGFSRFFWVSLAVIAALLLVFLVTGCDSRAAGEPTASWDPHGMGGES